MSRRPLLVFATALLLGLPAASAVGQTFVFHLSGDQEVPAVPSPATGGCMGVLDQVAGEFAVTCVHNVAGATLIHIHHAAAGSNGPAVFDMGSPASPVQATWTGMTAGDVTDLVNGDLYVNIHSGGRPDGEIRGQILERTVDSFSFSLDGDQEVPPSGSSATGSCTADLSDDATGLDVDCTHDVASPTAAHVHQAPAGEEGPVVFDFTDPTSPISATVPMDPVDVAAFAARHLYVNIHSADSPEGEIRGQIGAPPAPPTTGTIRIRKVTVPGGGTGFGFTDDVPGSPGSFTLDDGQVETFSSVPAGTYTVTEDDPAGTPGGFALGHVECDDGDSAGDPFGRTATIPLQGGELVTCTFENTQVPAAADLFVFGLDGGQEVPPVASPASGGCMGLLDQGAGTFVLTCAHDVSGATLMHIHRAPAGENGPILFDLGDPASPVQAAWTGMTPDDVADLLAGNLYVNIHTSGRPGGEIRGQIVERTVDSFLFPLSGNQEVPPGFSPAFGGCTADLSDDATGLQLDCTHTVAQPTAAHVHNAPRGQNGPVVFDFPDPSSPLSALVPMTPRAVAELVAGFFYVNVHSVNAPTGEIRGQIANQQAGFDLSIPTLGGWGMVLLALALAALALRRLAVRPGPGPGSGSAR